MKLKNFENFLEFNEKACNFCGLCFHKCPVMSLPLDIAKKEIESIIKTGKSKKVLNNCVGCMSCNHYCPNNCNPYALIINKWNEKYRKKGLPNRANLILTLPYKMPYIHSFIISKLPKEELEWIKEWEYHVKNGKETMIYAGCNLLLQPYILQSKLFENQTIFGSTELCCGEPLYRSGCFEGHELVAQNLKKKFEDIGFKKLITPCIACYHMFKYVYKKNYGIEMNFEVISIIDFLWDELNSGKYEIIPLNFTASIHDNCWSKASGDYFFNKVRDILKLCGVRVIELEHSREDALCCGISAASANYSIFPTLKHAKIRLKEFNNSKADIIVDYCGGCNWIFLVANAFSLRKKTKKPIYTLIEIVQMAIGEIPSDKSKKRGKLIIKALIGKIIRAYLSRGRYYIEEIC
ncbi:MAG: (Fe-S)-binding protein [Candidatus Hodarchaeota archaeon]